MLNLSHPEFLPKKKDSDYFNKEATLDYFSVCEIKI